MTPTDVVRTHINFRSWLTEENECKDVLFTSLTNVRLSFFQTSFSSFVPGEEFPRQTDFPTEGGKKPEKMLFKFLTKQAVF